MEDTMDEAVAQLDTFQEHFMFLLRGAIHGYDRRGIDFDGAEESLRVFMLDIVEMIDYLEWWLFQKGIGAIPEVVEQRDVLVPASFDARLEYTSNALEVLSLHVADVIRLAPRLRYLMLVDADELLGLANEMIHAAEEMDEEQKDFEEEEGGEHGESSTGEN